MYMICHFKLIKKVIVYCIKPTHLNLLSEKEWNKRFPVLWIVVKLLSVKPAIKGKRNNKLN